MTTITIDMIKKSIDNFNKMLADETVELIRINYWILLENQFNKFVEINPNTEVLTELIFGLLQKNEDFLKSKSLFFLIINYAQRFEKGFIYLYFKYVLNLVNNYEDSKYVFHDYLFEFTFNLIIKNNQIKDENLERFMKIMVESDIELVLFQLMKCFQKLSRYLSENEGNLSKNIKMIIEKIIEIKKLSKLSNIISFFEKILDNNDKNISGVIQFIEYTIEKLRDINFKNDESKSMMNVLIQINQLILKLDKGKIEVNKLENYLLLSLEYLLENRYFSLQLLETYFEFIKFDLNVFNESLLFYIYSITSEIYDLNSFEIVIEILNELCLRNLKISIYLTKIIYKKFELQGKFKQTQIKSNIKVSNFMKLNDENLTKGLKNSDINVPIDSFKYYDKYSDYMILSDINLINFIMKKCFSFEEDNSAIVNECQFQKSINLILNFNLERYNQQFRNFFVNFFISLIFQFTPQSDNSIELIFSKIQDYPDKGFIKSNIYPLVISYLQSFYFEKLFENLEKNLRIIKILFEFLFEYNRDDNIFNLSTKLLQKLFSLNNQNLINKKVALDIYTKFILKKNSGKFFDLYFKFILANLKNSSSSPKIEFLLYQTLYLYCRSYEGGLFPELESYLFNTLETNLEALITEKNHPNIGDYKLAFNFACIFELIKKDEPKNIIDKIFDYFIDNRFIKIIQIFSRQDTNLKSNEIFDLLNNNTEKLNYSNILDLLNEGIDFDLLQNKSLIRIIVFSLTSKIYSIFFRNLVQINNELFNDQKNYTTNSIVISIFKNYDYIFNNVILKENSKNSIYSVIFIDELFSNYENLVFYFSTYCYFKAISHIQEGNLDLSLLSQINNKIISENNNSIFQILIFNKNYYFMVNSYHNILNYESRFFQDINQLGLKDVNYVIEDIEEPFWTTEIPIKALPDYFFSKLIIEKFFIVEENNEEMFDLIFSENTLMRYFKNQTFYFNSQFMLIIIYNTLRNLKTKKINNEIKKNIYKNLYLTIYVFAKNNKGFFITFLRLLSNEITFFNMLHDNCLSKEFMIILDFMAKNILIYNSYRIPCSGYFNSIMNNLEKSIYESKLSIENSQNNGELFFIDFILKINSFISDKLKSKKEDRDINKKLLETIQGDLLQKIMNLNIYFVTQVHSLSKISSNYLEFLTKLSRFSEENKISYKGEEFQSFYEYEGYLSNTSDLMNLKKLLFRILNSEGKERKLYVCYLLHKIIKEENIKITYDIMQNLLHNNDFVQFKQTKFNILAIMLSSQLIDGYQNLDIFINNLEELQEISVYMIKNISSRFELHKLINFPKNSINFC